MVGDKKTIYLNDTKGTIQRRRFTLAHELGHIVLDHPLKPAVYRNSEVDENKPVTEVQANVFACHILMPAGVLATLHVSTVDEIMQICNVYLVYLLKYVYKGSQSYISAICLEYILLSDKL